MATESTNRGPGRPRRPIRRWVRLAFIVWAIGSTAWMANTMRTRGVAPETLQSDASLEVVDSSKVLAFRPLRHARPVALVFICGAGVTARAYAPMLRPIAEQGYPTFIIKLPFRLAPLESHKQEAMNRVLEVIDANTDVADWVVAGHSQGAALASRLVYRDPARFQGLVLIGTTHPKRQDLSDLQLPVIKIVGTADGVAPLERAEENRHLLPSHTRWVQIDGGNHSQFGHYGRQLFDGRPTITREAQQAATRDQLLQALSAVEKSTGTRLGGTPTSTGFSGIRGTR